jgi:hypothetical protein
MIGIVQPPSAAHMVVACGIVLRGPDTGAF